MDGQGWAGSGGNGIVAGENTEAAWAPDHESFAAVLEAEKRAFHQGTAGGMNRGGVGELDGGVGPKPAGATSVFASEEGNRARFPAEGSAVLPPFLQRQDEKLRQNEGDQARDAFRSFFDLMSQAGGPSGLPLNMNLNWENENKRISSNQGRDGPLESTGRKQQHPRHPFSMTPKDIELVIRMHNKQLEYARPLIDDYYLHELNRKRNIPDEYLTNPDIDLDFRTVSEMQRRAQPNSFHTAANSATLEKSLGTLQSWTPKAPRKLVEVAPMKSESLLFQVTDDRVGVRALIELGYDILAVIDDVRRRPRPHPDSQLRIQLEAEKLYGVFGISVDSAEDEKKKKHSEKLFAQMCAMTKGKRLVERALQVFQPAHQALVIAALLRHLGFLCNRDLFTDIEWSESEPFWITVCNSLSAITSLPSLLWILWSFLDGHVDNDEGFVTALGSEYGGRVIYVLLSRAYAICAAASPPPDPQQIREWNQIFAKFCTIALDELGTIFRRSENLSRTWEITAMLDALSEDRERERVRTTVTQLLRSGVAPPPKKVAENAAR